MRAEGVELWNNSRSPAKPRVRVDDRADCIGFDGGGVSGDGVTTATAAAAVGVPTEDVTPESGNALSGMEFPDTDALYAALSPDADAVGMASAGGGSGDLARESGREAGSELFPNLDLDDFLPSAPGSDAVLAFEAGAELNPTQQVAGSLDLAGSAGVLPPLGDALAVGAAPVVPGVSWDGLQGAVGHPGLGLGPQPGMPQPGMLLGQSMGAPGDHLLDDDDDDEVEVVDVDQDIEEVEVLDLDDPDTERMLEERRKEIERMSAKRIHDDRVQAEMMANARAAAVRNQVVDIYDSDEEPYNVPVGGFGASQYPLATAYPAAYPTTGAYQGNYYAVPPPKPAEEFDKKLIKQLVDNHNMSADATEEIENPSELNVPLLRHQKRAVAWMQKRETTGAAPVDRQEAASSAYGAVEESDDSDFEAAPAAKAAGIADKDGEASCLGGILADEQGLGKTLSVIALMLVNPPPAVDGKPGKWRSLIICPVSLVGQWKEEIESLFI